MVFLKHLMKLTNMPEVKYPSTKRVLPLGKDVPVVNNLIANMAMAPFTLVVCGFPSS